ncbi:hypothetical protein CEXT_793501 [Caerostris extrusa]|uniref:Uncharacterized protein n=1 Tax=Caerostris extrusa TaxID=172846 RepID=A0AAV4SQQ8_CAEEX|nr:hypothetical protein CEXT_793501 [Caerostris extrusa]
MFVLSFHYPLEAPPLAQMSQYTNGVVKAVRLNSLERSVCVCFGIEMKICVDNILPSVNTIQSGSLRTSVKFKFEDLSSTCGIECFRGCRANNCGLKR